MPVFRNFRPMNSVFYSSALKCPGIGIRSQDASLTQLVVIHPTAITRANPNSNLVASIRLSSSFVHKGFVVFGTLF